MPPPWIVHTFWRAHRVLYRVRGGRFLWTTARQEPRPVRARCAVGEERDRLWQRWAAVDPDLDAFARRRAPETPVVVLEPRGRTV